MKCWLIVGLGNPEGKYFSSYHNLGWSAAEKYAKDYNLEFKKKGNQLIVSHITDNCKVFVLKPLTYMNLSGQAVVAVSRKYKIAPENIIVLCDDIYIDAGSIRISNSGSAGGHNGLKSINELLNTNAYIKIRIGAKPKNEIKGSTADYVLSKIPPEIKPQIDKAIEDGVSAVKKFISGEKTEIIKGEFNKRNLV
jgi:PTH1 family peptidyl-tRNA hydrolase